jgi:integrase
MTENKRRGHNEGSVYYEESRDRWVAAVSIGPGQRKKFYFKTKQEALKKKNEALRELEQGTLATGPRRKLQDYLEDWIENVHKDKLRISTYVKYKKLIKYILADLGDVWLQKLTPEQVRRFYTKLEKEGGISERGLSSKTIHEIHGVLHLALKNAVRWGYVSRNICDLVEPPRIVSREATPLTLEQAHILLEYVRKHRLEILLTMAVVTGMRRGELLALRWSNIDFERRSLLVLHTVDYIPRYGYVETEPKTAAGKRLVSLPSFLVEMLKQHRVQQLEVRLKQGNDWENRDLVFPDLHGGYFNPNYLLRMFKKVLQEAAIPHMHFHDLRHSAATILLSMGVNMKVIQELLGHSDIAITLGRYSHLLPSMQREVIDKWDVEFGHDGGRDEGEGDEEIH